MGSVSERQTVAVIVRDMSAAPISERLLWGDAMNAHNSFVMLNSVQQIDFRHASMSADGLELRIPSMAVAACAPPPFPNVCTFLRLFFDADPCGCHAREELFLHKQEHKNNRKC